MDKISSGIFKLRLFSFICTYAFIASCNKTYRIDNQYVSIEAPKYFNDITDPNENDILYLVKFEDIKDTKNHGGLQSIFCIDNIQDNLLIANGEYLKTTNPVEVLANRLESIKSDAENETGSSYWTEFCLVEKPKKIDFKGYDGAVAEFEVEEKIDYLNKSIKKRIRRYVVFLDKDLWNIVVAATTIESYDKEIVVFDEMLESLVIKKAG